MDNILMSIFVISVSCLCESAIISQNSGLLKSVTLLADATYTDLGPYVDSGSRAMRHGPFYNI